MVLDLWRMYTVPAHYHNKAIFLDRDGILNQEIGDYVYRPEDFLIPEGTADALRALKAAGYRLIVVTNQGGIGKGLYTAQEMHACHAKLHQACPNVLDAVYYSPHHSTVSRSQLSKPNSLMLEKGIHRFRIDPTQSYMVGDAGRDLEAADKVGIRGILVPTLKEREHPLAIHVAASFPEAAEWILGR